MNPAQLADTQLEGVDGQVHRLGDYWSDRRIVVVFLRHFG
ncbi:unannotated protein [freshwater metagenome]|uniref:Unannotated protein n=1 Tax=freshwater metagenome TaxID=449393 RepID=A0A6J7FPP5_9ZZZZ